jgi:hypothetical protein
MFIEYKNSIVNLYQVCEMKKIDTARDNYFTIVFYIPNDKIYWSFKTMEDRDKMWERIRFAITAYLLVREDVI